MQDVAIGNAKHFGKRLKKSDDVLKTVVFGPPDFAGIAEHRPIGTAIVQPESVSESGVGATIVESEADRSTSFTTTGACESPCQMSYSN